MSVDIVAILAKTRTSDHKHLLTQLLPNASPSSTQHYLDSLVSRTADQAASHDRLLTLLRLSSCLCRDNGEKLVPILTKSINRPGASPETQCPALQCVTLLVEHSELNTETSKTISTATPGMINSIVTSVEQNGQHYRLVSCSLSLLSALMSRYPGSCGHSRVKIHDMLVSLLGVGSVDQQLLGQCYILLCQVGGGGRDGVEHTAHYTSMMASLVSTLHTGLDKLLAGVRELDHFQDIVSLAAPLKLKDSGGVEQLARQLDSLLAITGQLLLRGFPQNRRVPVDRLLSVAVRLMSVTMQNVNTPHQHLISCLHKTLCSSSLVMTRDMITCLRDQLIPEAARINSLILAGLTRFSDTCVRGQVYMLLETWLQCVGLSTGLEYCASQIVTNIIKDLAPISQKMMLQTNVGGGKRGSKKKKGGGHQSTIGSAKTIDGGVNDEVCEAAVSTLHQLINVMGCWLDKGTHAKMTQCVVTRLLSPDTKPQCVPGLMSCLHGLVSVPSPTTLSPAQIALPVIAKFLHDPKLSVQSRNILQSLHSMLHPQRPTLDIREHTTATLDILDPVNDDESVEDDIECVAAETQTENVLEEDKTPTNDDDEMRNKCSNLEQKISKLSSTESVLRAELLRKEMEIRKLKAQVEKRTVSSDSNPSPSKKAKVDSPNNNPPSIPSNDVKAGNTEKDENRLTVQDMMKDFSDKLKDNILPKFTQDSDSE